MISLFSCSALGAGAANGTSENSPKLFRDVRAPSVVCRNELFILRICNPRVYWGAGCTGSELLASVVFQLRLPFIWVSTSSIPFFLCRLLATEFVLVWFWSASSDKDKIRWKPTWRSMATPSTCKAKNYSHAAVSKAAMKWQFQCNCKLFACISHYQNLWLLKLLFWHN